MVSILRFHTILAGSFDFDDLSEMGISERSQSDNQLGFEETNGNNSLNFYKDVQELSVNCG